MNKKTHAVCFTSLAGTLAVSHYCAADKVQFWSSQGYTCINIQNLISK
jgi:hypothetical protein